VARLTAAGMLALAVMLGTVFMNAIPASAAPRAAGSAVSAALPDIREATCTSARATWVHVSDSYGLQCYGGAGRYNFTPMDVAFFGFCAGNNYGHYKIFDQSNMKFYVKYFKPGFSIDYPNDIFIVYLKIKSWSGSDTC
jgi:hypothetical protein